MKKQKGITLIEILVALAILGMISLALYGILKGGLDVWRGGKERTDIIAQARVAMDRLTREAREATYIASTKTDSINFSAYLGQTTGDPYNLTYSYYNSILYRGIGVPPVESTIAYSVATFTLTYYSKDSGGVYAFTTPPSTTTARNSIWMIEIETKLKRGLTGEEAEVDLRSTVQPRNYPK